MKGATGWVAAWVGTTVLLAAGSPAEGQVIRGLVLDSEDDRPVTTAVIRLLDAELDQEALAISDSLGRYRLAVPGPGQYHVSAERIGYDPFTSHLFEVGDSEGDYPVDLAMLRVPLPISGIVVSAERFAELDRGIRREIGMRPSSLRFKPLMRPELEHHWQQGHNVEDVIRWSSLPGIIVKQTTDGPCFQWRSRGCIDVFLNSFRVSPEFVPILPLDMVETLVVVTPEESLLYPGGGVLLYTAGFIR
jgi:hypothetical protein